MAGMERRVDAVESRVDAIETRLATAVSAAVSQDAASALAAHRQNTRLLTALRETQAEHSRTLVEHSRRFDVVDARFDAIERTLGGLTVGMHTIESLLRRALDDEG